MDFKSAEYKGDTRRFSWLLTAVIFIVVFISHYASPVLQRTDSWWVMHTSMSIVREGNLNLDEFKVISEQTDNHNLDRIDGKTYMRYPLGVSLLAIPFVAIADAFSGHDLYADLNSSHLSTKLIKAVEKTCASFFVALTAVVIFLISRMFANNIFSLVPTAVFAFGTSAWSTASRGMWQHGPSMLMLALCLYLILEAKKRPGIIILAAIPLATAYLMRPTNSLSVIAITLYVVLVHRKYAVRFLLAGSAVFLPFILVNLTVYGTILPPYYSENLSRRFLLTDSNVIIALSGNIISPARGLLIYSPVLALAGAGIYLKLKSGSITLLDYLLISVLTVHWLVISMFGHWYGGYSFGPRFFSDMLPYLIYFFIPVVAYMQDSKAKYRLAVASTVAVLASFSFFVNYMGAVYQETFTWNNEPISIDRNTSRLWDWNDLPFLRGL